jgi:hypothetical protein
MNIFRQSLEEIQANAGPDEAYIDLLPGLPSFLTKKEAACICFVSDQTIDRMVERGIFILNEDSLLRKSDLINYISTHTLADVPTLEEKDENME